MLRIIFLMVLLAAGVAGCSKNEEKINIGYMGTLSGRYSDLGQATLQGVMLAIEVSPVGERVNLVVRDDYGRPAEGAALLDEFSEAGVKYIIGPNLSSVASTVVPLLGTYGIFMMSPTASTSSLAGKKDNFARIIPNNSRKQTEGMSSYLINKLKINDIVILYDARNASYSNDIVKTFTESFMNHGGSIRDVRPFNPDSRERLGSLIEKDSANPPELYYVIGSAMDTSLIIWQMKKRGFGSKILIRKWATSDDFYRLGGEAVEGVMLFDYYVDQNSPAYAEFAKAYKNRFQKEPSWMNVYGYEAAMLLLNGLDDIQSGTNFVAALSKASAKGELFTDIEFDEYGDSYLPLHYFIIEKGETAYQGIAE
ncbi:ABC transporter substrate-binding protein [Deferribacteres bacterium DY0037]